MREFGTIAQKVFSRSYDKSADPFEIYDDFVREMNAINAGNSDSDVVHVRIAADKAKESVEARLNSNDGIAGIPSSMREVNRILAGYGKSDLIIIGARPGMGKSGYAASEAIAAAMSGHKVLVFSLEMSSEQWVYRWNAMLSQINVEQLAKYKLDNSRLSEFYRANETIRDLPIWIDDRSGINVYQIRDKAKRQKNKYGLDMVIIDYLQLISGDNKRRMGSRENELSEISRNLKIMAKELDVPVIALSQLSRKCEERSDKRPMLSDLRESGAIEQDADVVGFLYRPSYYDEHTTDADELIVAKQRNGSTGIVRVKFLADQTRYVDIRTQINTPF